MWVIDRVYSIFEAYGTTYGVDVSSCDGVISSYTYQDPMSPADVKKAAERAASAAYTAALPCKQEVCNAAARSASDEVINHHGSPMNRIEFSGDLKGYVQKAICELKVDEATKKAHRDSWQKFWDSVWSGLWNFLKDCWEAIKDACEWLADEVCKLVNSSAGAYVFAGIGCATGALIGGGMAGCTTGAKVGVAADALTKVACGSGTSALAANHIKAAATDAGDLSRVMQPFPEGSIYRLNKKLGVYALYVPEQYASLRNLFTTNYSSPVTLGDDAATPGPGHSDPPPTGTVWATDVGAKPTGKQFTDGGTEDVPWYESPIVWVGIGVGAAAVTTGAVLLVRRKHAHDSVKK
jgi:hypothetical protein